MNEQIPEESKTNWLDDEYNSIPAGGDYEKKPTPQFEENKITRMKIDASKKFEKWKDAENNKTKAIIPCKSVVDGQIKDCNWWLNIKNPAYREVVRKCREAADKTAVEVAVLQTGSKQNTKYTLVKE